MPVPEKRLVLSRRALQAAEKGAKARGLSINDYLALPKSERRRKTVSLSIKLPEAVLAAAKSNAEAQGIKLRTYLQKILIDALAPSE